ncbi:MAG: shikimate dehydrogenase [Anaerolineae bacterium]
MSITGRTRVAGVLGWPIAHSLSPAMHNAAFEALGLDWVYVPFAVPPENLRAGIAGLRALGFVGANITIPHKQAVMDLVDEVTPAATVIGAVNTLVIGDRIVGDNTDWTGFLWALRDVGCYPAGQRAVVLGAGGAARSVVYALASVGADVAVYNRHDERADSLVRDLRPSFPRVNLEAYPMDALRREAENRPALIVNTTSLGMAPRIEQTPWPSDVRMPSGATAYDLVYNPLATRFLKGAKAAGARAVDGLGMLVYQGAIAFKMWTGVEPPTDVMYQTCLEYL